MSTIEPTQRWCTSAATYLLTTLALLICGHYDIFAETPKSFHAQGYYSAELNRGSANNPSKVIVYVGTGEVFTHKFLSHVGNGRIIRLERAPWAQSRTVEESLDSLGSIILFVGPGRVTYLNSATEVCFVTFHTGPVPVGAQTGY